MLDTLRRKEEAPLETLHKFVIEQLSDSNFFCGSLLPIFPRYSSTMVLVWWLHDGPILRVESGTNVSESFKRFQSHGRLGH